MLSSMKNFPFNFKSSQGRTADFESLTKNNNKMSNFKIVRKLIELSRSFHKNNVIIVRNIVTKRKHVEPPKIERATQSRNISSGGYLLLVRKLT